MIYSDAGIASTKKFEGLWLIAYQDSVGVWTIGYGHTGPDVHEGLTISEATADSLLLHDIRHAVTCVNAYVTVPLSQGQFDALVDFAFNLGCQALHGSTLLRRLNAGDMEGAASEFVRWDHAGGKVLPGLLARRQAEEKMFRETK